MAELFLQGALDLHGGGHLSGKRSIGKRLEEF
jgi:hypothetical protein